MRRWLCKLGCEHCASPNARTISVELNFMSRHSTTNSAGSNFLLTRVSMSRLTTNSRVLLELSIKMRMETPQQWAPADRLICCFDNSNEKQENEENDMKHEQFSKHWKKLLPYRKNNFFRHRRLQALSFLEIFVCGCYRSQLEQSRTTQWFDTSY